MQKEITIRNATIAGMQSILDIYNDALINTTAIYQEEPHTLQMRKAWFEDKQQAGLPVFVAEVDGTFAGFNTYGPFRTWPGYRFTVEHSVYVSADLRGLGVGKKLVLKVIDSAHKQHMHVLIAGIDTNGAASISLHESLGFEEVAHFKQVGFKFNQWLDLKFFQLTL